MRGAVASWLSPDQPHRGRQMQHAVVTMAVGQMAICRPKLRAFSRSHAAHESACRTSVWSHVNGMRDVRKNRVNMVVLISEAVPVPSWERASQGRT